MNLIRTVDAEREALTLDDVKFQLRIVDGFENDDAFNLFIQAIRHKTEQYISKTLITSTWQLSLDSFCQEIVLPMSPIASIETISYIDPDGVSQEFTDYQFDRFGRLQPSFGNQWPDTRAQFDAVTITYIAGETSVSADIKLAMLLWVGACDINRENNLVGTIVSEIPDGAKSYLQPYREQNL